jgi:hypothetical protein
MIEISRCRSPEMVEEEIGMHVLAYHPIRGVIARAARAHDRPPRRVSFPGAWPTMTAFSRSLDRASPGRRVWLLAVMLPAIAWGIGRVASSLVPASGGPRSNRTSPIRGRRRASD